MIVSLCCNDNAGRFERCIRAIDIEDALRLTALAIDQPPRMSFVEVGGVTTMVRIAGRRFPVTHYYHCSPLRGYDSVRMEQAVVAELLNYLKSRRVFEAENGAWEVFDIWQTAGERFSETNLALYVPQTKRPTNVSGDSAPIDAPQVAQNDLGRVSAAKEAE